jgi:hypothetical protein
MFDLRPLEGALIVFVGPCLVDSFGTTRLAWASLGHDPTSWMPWEMIWMMDVAFGVLRGHPRGKSQLAHISPTIFLWRLNHCTFWACVLLGARVWW